MKQGLLVGLVVGPVVAGGLVAVAPGRAEAGGKVLPGSARAKPVFVDESSTWLKSRPQGADGYHVELYAEVSNVGAKKHTARLDWKSKGKVVRAIDCTVNADEADVALVRCKSEGAPLDAKGPVEADLVLRDDADDKEYLIRTYRAEARAFDKATWAIVADDLLASAWATHWRSTDESDGRLRLRFWMTGTQTISEATLRCTVDGKPTPDIPASVETTPIVEADVIPARGARQTWRWSWVDVQPGKLMYGPDAKGAMAASARPSYRFLADTPGQWRCELRHERRPLRELSFTVDSKGFVVSSPLQQAAGAAPLAQGVALIDIRIPKEAGVDQRILPAQLGKTRMYGQPWPAHPHVATITKALPGKVENANPVPPPLPKGKLLPGTQHEPARVTDEATLQLRIANGPNYDGWAYKAAGLIAGYGGGDDVLRADLRQGKKVLSSWNCGIDHLEEEGVARFSCEPDDALTAAGPLELDLVYEDARDGNEYQVRTLAFTVAKFPMVKGVAYQVVPDEALGAAWVRQRSLRPAAFGKPALFLWLAQPDVPSRDVALRCTVGGSTKLDDIAVSFDPVRPLGLVEAKPTRGKELHYAWTHAVGDVQAYYGARADAQKQGLRVDSMVFLGEHPGAWVCQLRVAGKPVRELRFDVDKAGTITSPLHAAAGAPVTIPHTVAIDMRFVKGAAPFDTRIRPDRMKKSRAWGLPWPNAPEVKDIWASFPPASGLPDPK